MSMDTRCNQPKTAFLVLAHHHPEMLDRLLGRLSAPWAHGLIHVDAKAGKESFARVIEKHPAWTLLPDRDRVDVRWAGFSIVTAILSLYRHAVLRRPDTERFVLLSGCDYPLRPIEEIGHLISKDLDLIQIDRRLDANGDSEFDRIANRLFLGNYRPLNPRSGNRWVVAGIRRIEAKIRRPFPRGISIYYGSCWHCLTRNSVDSVLRFVSERPKVLNWFRHAGVPDEMLIHTILKTKGYEGKIAYDATVDPNLNRPATDQGTHFVEWNRPNPLSPRILDVDDVDLLTASTALFARKFDPIRSRALLDYLDQRIDRQSNEMYRSQATAC